MYELTYIISSTIDSKESDDIVKELESFIKSKEGVVLKSEKTIAKPLAYPIKKQSSGYFVFLTLQILENKVKEVKEKLQKNSKILRHFLIVKKPIKILKERRTRKPLFIKSKIEESPFTISGESKNKEEDVKIEDIDKKLDEILSE